VSCVTPVRGTKGCLHSGGICIRRRLPSQLISRRRIRLRSMGSKQKALLARFPRPSPIVARTHHSLFSLPHRPAPTWRGGGCGTELESIFVPLLLDSPALHSLSPLHFAGCLARDPSNIIRKRWSEIRVFLNSLALRGGLRSSYLLKMDSFHLILYLQRTK
jgi:hypothetical protein